MRIPTPLELLLLSLSVLCLGCGLPGGAPPPSGVGSDTGNEDGPQPRDDSGLRSLSAGGTRSELEVCDGVDNDGDGEIDEGFDDIDGDGVRDCVDLECAAASSEAAAATRDDACIPSAAASPAPWDVEIVHEVFSADASTTCADTVADIDGDGAYEIFFAYFDTLHILDAVTGAVVSEVSLPSYAFDSPWSVGDVDRDGSLEIFSMDEDGRIDALDHTGVTEWTSTESLGPTVAGMPRSLLGRGMRLYLADLDGDGHAEVWNQKGAVSALDGSWRLDLDGVTDPSSGYFHHASAADLDRDLQVELVHNKRIMDLSGSLLWSEDVDEKLAKLANPALLQLDSDTSAELAWLTQTDITYTEADGTELARDWTHTYSSTGSRNLALMCAGDFDGDGLMEVAIPDGDFLRVLDGDGTELWRKAIEDPSTGGACSVFDFDLDGRHEILHTDERQLTIRDGATGEPLYTDTDWDSATHFEHPLVVDLDGDGSVEIIGIGTGAYAGDSAPRVKIYSHTDRAWPPGFPGWYGSDWSGVGRRSDGRIPHTADASWLETGIWRGQPATPGIGMDLRPELVDACIASCELEEAEVRLAVRVVNVGSEEAHEEGRLGVYLLDEAGVPALHRLYEVEEVYPPEPASEDGDTGTPDPPEPLGFIDEGAASPSVEVLLTLAQARHGVLLVAGDDGSDTASVEGFECASDDNAITWRPEVCDDAAE